MHPHEREAITRGSRALAAAPGKPGEQSGLDAGRVTVTPDEDEEMLQTAHAAMYFWKIVGNSRNQAHAAQLVAHVYALLGQAEPAKYFQAKSQPMLLGQGAEAWEQAMAHAVAANVAAANNDAKVHGEHYREAVRLTESLADADRKVLNATLEVVPRPKGL